MTDNKVVVLEERGICKISGADARDFLQGLITNDIELAAEKRAIHTGLLSPQGKILFEFLIVAEGDGYLIDVAAEYLPDLIKRLNMYKLRADVEIKDMSNEMAVGISDAGLADPRYGPLGNRIIVKSGKFEGAGAEKYHTLRISLGIAEMGMDYGSGEVYPHEANFDLLNGVSFTKGCYVGQEVVSRMQHKTDIRKRFAPVKIDGPAPEPGTQIYADGKKAGVVGSSQTDRGIALLRMDRIENAKKIMAGDAVLTPVQPEWAKS